jgi:hypothetical protein
MRMARSKPTTARMWIEAGLAAATGVLTAITIVSREWIEFVFGVDPDHGNGALEWALVAVLAVATIGFTAAARAEWRRVRIARSVA